MLSRRSIYDNWGRLVWEVLKREQFWQLCHDHSRSPSILSSTISDDVSFDFPSPSTFWLQKERVDAQRDQDKKKEVKALSSISGVVSIAMNMMAEKKLAMTVKLTKLRRKLYHQNAETVTRQKLASYGSNMKFMKIFTSKELIKATDNFAEDKIQGRGGFGTVYKGILHDNKQLVAITRSRFIDDGQLEIFIIQVTILGLVNHPNIVKLLGCCLEIKAPLLVFEYLQNTLFYQIYNDGGQSWFSWGNRLRVASEVAGALAYLHSSDIIHLNVKSTNILMDEYYTAKISGFGSSMLVPIDQTEDDGHPYPLTGTIGYLDPECFHTKKLTKKSDVYSFGVVLAELMTGRQPFSFTEIEDKGHLATLFLTSLEENQLFQILDPRVVMEDCIEQLFCAAQLVKRCLSFHGEERPNMKEVVVELEGIRNLKFGEVVPQEIQQRGIGMMIEWPLDSYGVISKPEPGYSV